MRRFMVILVLCLFMTCFVAPCKASTYEQAKKAHVTKVMTTNEGAAIKGAVDKYSVQYGMDPVLIHAVILTESGYNTRAKSPCGASGLMQLMPGTFYSKGFKNIYSIEENVHAGVKHLAGLKARYNGNIYLALAAYNAGGGYVSKYGGVVPPSIKPYVNKVMTHKQIIESLF